MRVTSDLWISALVRRVFSDGGFAVVRRKGALEAGAIFVLQRTRMGELELYGPAPQTSYDDARPSERYFTRMISTLVEEDVEKRIAREVRFDPDIWLVEVETAKDLGDYLVVTE